MDSHETTASLGHLTKTALPVIGRVGTVTGGLVSLLAVLDAVTNELVIIVGGVLLVAAVTTSAIVVFHSTTRVLEEQRVKTSTYPKRARILATIVMVVAGFLLAVGGIGVTLSRIGMFGRGGGGGGRPPLNKAAALTLIPNPQVGTAIAIATQVRSTPVPGTPAPATTSVEQITDVIQLNKLGAEALRAMNLSRALFIFNRALQIEATNAQAQLGLGITYFYLNNHQPAMTPLSTALKLDPKLVDAHAYLGFIYDYRLDFVRAKAEYDEFLRVAPADHSLRMAVQERGKKLAGSQPPPTLTPFATPVFTATPAK